MYVNTSNNHTVRSTSTDPRDYENYSLLLVISLGLSTEGIHWYNARQSLDFFFDSSQLLLISVGQPHHNRPWKMYSYAWRVPAVGRHLNQSICTVLSKVCSFKTLFARPVMPHMRSIVLHYEAFRFLLQRAYYQNRHKNDCHYRCQ